MVNLQELTHYLEAFLEVSTFEDYCPNGQQVEGKEDVHKLVTAVSANLETIQAAVDAKADALLVHHGIFWKGDPYPITGVKKKKLELLLHHGISLLAYHLPLDAHPLVGNNWKAAQDLGWNDLEPFSFQGTPIGVEGSFSPLHVKDLQEKLETFYGHKAHTALGGKETISSAALVSGGAYRGLMDAAERGVDCFITGNYDEPAYHMALELGIHFFALGHHATEKIGPQCLGDHLHKKFDLSTKFLEIPNPF